MRARNHIIISAGLAAGLQATLHSWPATLTCFFSGFLIDIDHFLEYYLHHKKLPERYQQLVDFCLNYKAKKIYLIFHAYEYLFILWGLIYIYHLGPVYLGLALGLTVHLILDQFSNPIKPLFYFLFYRVQNNFEAVKILKT